VGAGVRGEEARHALDGPEGVDDEEAGRRRGGGVGREDRRRLLQLEERSGITKTIRSEKNQATRFIKRARAANR
ncbi:MAG TPA: hypothetical protein VLT47_00145, partial [Anaeromyxobacteraceae bacterium]|nr:hypothetical protein [Anaeromyxobacteraceae bacterium]